VKVRLAQLASAERKSRTAPPYFSCFPRSPTLHLSPPPVKPLSLIYAKHQKLRLPIAIDCQFRRSKLLRTGYYINGTRPPDRFVSPLFNHRKTASFSRSRQHASKPQQATLSHAHTATNFTQCLTTDHRTSSRSQRMAARANISTSRSPITTTRFFSRSSAQRLSENS
jgi:hypothetical protein